MMNAAIAETTLRMSEFPGGINGSKCISMLRHLSNHANYVNGGNGINYMSLYILPIPLYVWENISIDIVYLPIVKCGNKKYKYAVFARDDLYRWIEGRALELANSESVTRLIFEDVICRHGCP